MFNTHGSLPKNQTKWITSFVSYFSAFFIFAINAGSKGRSTTFVTFFLFSISYLIHSAPLVLDFVSNRTVKVCLRALINNLPNELRSFGFFGFDLHTDRWDVLWSNSFEQICSKLNPQRNTKHTHTPPAHIKQQKCRLCVWYSARLVSALP